MHKYFLTFILSLFILVSCGENSQEPKISAEQVIEKFKRSGIELTDIKQEKRDPNGSLPNSYRDRWSFIDVKLNNGSGGQVIVCDEKSHCDAIYAYFDALKALAGPYLYRNSTGTIILQLNSGHSPESAKRYQTIVSGL